VDGRRRCSSNARDPSIGLGDIECLRIEVAAHVIPAEAGIHGVAVGIVGRYRKSAFAFD
jgi:hypothetical protein